MLYTDLCVVIFKLLNFFGWQNIGGGGAIAPPPAPTAMESGIIRPTNSIYMESHSLLVSKLSGVPKYYTY